MEIQYVVGRNIIRTGFDCLLDAGLNIMMLDCYTKERYIQFKAMFPDAAKLYEDGYHGYRYIGPKERKVLLVDGTHGANHIIRRWHNCAGSVNVARARAAGYDVITTDKPLNAMCVRPFREIEVHVDGTVTICCVDWKEEAIVGNIKDTSTKELWNRMDMYREPLLRHARRELVPCNKCSERCGFHVGLESDWFNVEK